MREPIVRDQYWTSATIASSGTTSSAIPTGGRVIFGLVMPAAFTGATISFTVSHDGTTYQELRKADTDAAVSVAVTASKNYDLPTQLAAWPYFKIVSASAEASARTLYVAMKG